MSIFAEEFQEAQAAAAAEEAAKVTDAQVVAEVAENRTEYTKQFKLDNGLFVAAVYAEPVHYLEDGQWKDIDNTLKSTADGTYTNTAGVWDVDLPSQLTGKSPISITKDGYTLSFQMAGELLGSGNLQTKDISLDAANQPFSVSPTKSTRGKIQALDFTTARESAEHEEFVLEKSASQILYSDVYENTNIQYDLQGNRVKESIIIDSYSSTLRGYRYILNVGKMVPVLNDDGSIHFYDEAEESIVMTMPAPYLIDDNGAYNFDVQVSLEGKDGVYTLMYLLPSQWMSAQERAWPVVLDPMVNADFSRSNIQDITVAQVPPSGPNVNVLECGYHPDKHHQRFYVQYVNLPALTSSDVVVEAQVQLIKAETSKLSAPVVEVRKVLGTWDQSTITWENQPAVGTLVEDFNVTKYANYYTWDVTDIVRGWYSSGNTGMVFQMPSVAEETTTEDWQQFWSSEFAWDTNRPYLTLKFRNNNGIEDSWDYATASAGRAGTGYVNTYTGNLTWIRSDLGFGGNRMPVSISHTYNLNDSAENDYGMGYGWRTNFNQRVYRKTISGTTYYVLEDGDGTDHYFYGSYGTYYDEDNLSLTLTTNGTNVNEKICIKDKQGNASYFYYNENTNIGYLTRQANNQKTPSSIKIFYTDATGQYIDYIKDGIDRTYDFIYESGNLSYINYLGTGSEALYTVGYSYTDNKLTEVLNVDGGRCSYTYEGNLLQTAEDIDGYKLTYTFTDADEDYQPHRVASVEESYNNTLGGSLTLEYAHNQTTLTDHNDNVEILQFNNFGNTVCIQDDEGRAQYSKYTVNDASETGKANQLRLSSKLQNTVSDFLYDGGFERGTLWNVASGSDGDCSIIAAAKYMGNNGLFIHGAIQLYTTAFTAQPGQSYTFSGYVKASGNVSVNLNLRVGDSDYNSQELQNSDWTRLEVHYTNNSDQPKTVTPQIITTGTDYVYVDCLQIEKNPTASRYNLVDNGDFRHGGSGWSELPASAKIIDGTSVVGQLDGQIYHATGTPASENRISQTVNVSGEKGDTFVLTGWAKGDAVPTPKESNESKQRYYGIIGKFNYTESGKESKTFVAKFNPDTNSTANWQYSAEMMVAEYPYSSITIYIAYDRSANEAWFDGIQLFKEEFGHSYTYDDDGNVIATKDLQNKNTEYKYENGDLVKILEDDKVKMTYTYDGHHNVIKSTSAEGLQQNYTYDQYGNNLTVTVIDPDSSKKITTASVYTDDGNRLGYTQDSLGRITYYSYNADTNVLEWVQYPEDVNAYEETQIDTKTFYAYDNMYRTIAVAANKDTGGALSADYTYSGDYLTNIQTKTTNYGFSYGNFGLRSGVSAGIYNLATYTYSNDRNFYLESLDYSNENKVQYKYDDKGRMTKQTYEDGDTVTYHYDNYGALASITDSATGRTTTYYYDFTDRLMKYVESGNGYEHSLSYEYDDKNNLKSTTETHYGNSYTTQYTYDDDNRVDTITANNAAREYSFDDYGRTDVLKTTHSTKSTDNEGNETTTKTEVKKDSYTFSATESTTSSQIASHTVHFGAPDANDNYSRSVTYSYTYDENGNITSISDGTYTTTYVYDTANQLIRENNQEKGYTYIWSYDNGGNILTKHEYAYTTSNSGQLIDVVVYEYGLKDTGWGDVLTTYDGKNISYDAVGNPLNDGTWTYDWEHGRQLASMSNGTTTWSYTYNADGLRTSRTNGATTYNYTYNGDKLTYMTVNGYLHLYFAYDASGVPMSVTYNGTTYYYVTNVQGDVIGILDSTGAQVATYAYDAWGNPLAGTESQTSEIGTLNPLRYRSYVYDSETELYYLQSRYYNPEMGRFINGDDPAYLGVSGLLSYNLFAYCGNNPIMGYDPTGTWDWGAALNGAGLLATGLTAIAVAATILTCGAAAPLMVAVAAVTVTAGVLTTVNGVAEVVEAGTGYNVVRDGAFGGNTRAYETYRDVTSTVAQVGTAICGSYSAAKGGNVCFVAGTPVRTSKGSQPIESIQAGDYVWAWDEESGDVALKEVVQTFVNEADELIHVFVNNEEIVCTTEHPFYSPVKGWTAACKLRAGDILVTVNGEFVVVEKVQHEILESPVTVYNFEVEDYHTYYVSSINVLVHNMCKKARITNVSKAESNVWNSFKQAKNGLRTSGSGKNIRYYSWDHTHNEIEVFNRMGKHLGAIDPSTGEWIKAAVKGRYIKL